MNQLQRRAIKWMIAISICTMPQFFLRCDRAAINFQRGLLQGAGFLVSELAFDALLGSPSDGDNL